MWIGPIGGPWEIEKQFDDPTRVIFRSFGLDGRIPILIFTEGFNSVGLLDAATGDLVGTPTSGSEVLVSTEASGDGSLLAASFGTLDTLDTKGTTVIIDAESGQELFRFDSEQPASSMVFDMEANELVLAMPPNKLLTIDLAEGDILRSVELPVLADLVEVGIRPDGQVVVVLSNEVLVVDRRSGAVTSSRKLRDVVYAWFRPDGSLFASNSGAQRTGVIDLEGNALIREAHPIESFVFTTFNDGLVATVLAPSDSTVEVSALASGERSATELVTTDGEQFTPHTVYADSRGLWAVDFGNVFTRWEDGLLVDRLDLGGNGRHRSGNRLGALYSYWYWDEDGESVVSLIDFESTVPEVLFTVSTAAFARSHPTPDGGMIVLNRGGELAHYDSEGEELDRSQTLAQEAYLIALDPSSGTLAAAAPDGSVWIIDPATGRSETLPTQEPISNIDLGRDGELLVLTGPDGTVRLWDIQRSESAGVAWSGTGSSTALTSWFDADANSIWVATSGSVVNLPLDPALWIERACDVIGRNLTQDEWDRYVPGDGQRRSACGLELTE